jgi:hypothetical protein
MALPRHFCWTRYGTEAGESFEEILLRKEKERNANGGTFLWGIGNSLGRSVEFLAEREYRPLVVFSPIKSRPRTCDTHPMQVAEWKSAETISGSIFQLPKHSTVRSRFDTQEPKNAHYALVCFSSRPLHVSQAFESLTLDGLENLVSGRRVGASQVTAVVRQCPNGGKGTAYAITMVVELRTPYFVKLRNPMPLPSSDARLGSNPIAALQRF